MLEQVLAVAFGVFLGGMALYVVVMATWKPAFSEEAVQGWQTALRRTGVVIVIAAWAFFLWDQCG